MLAFLALIPVSCQIGFSLFFLCRLLSQFRALYKPESNIQKLLR